MESAKSERIKNAIDGSKKLNISRLGDFEENKQMTKKQKKNY